MLFLVTKGTFHLVGNDKDSTATELQPDGDLRQCGAG